MSTISKSDAYAAAGVDITAGYKAVELMKQHIKRTVTEGVIRSGGNAVILAHNHPSNVLVPSGDDIISTKHIAVHLAANDIDLIEHYIVGKTDCVGFFAENNGI